MRLGGTTALLATLLLAVPACGGGGDTSESAANDRPQAEETFDYGPDYGNKCLETQKGQVVTLKAGRASGESFAEVTWFPNDLKLPAGKFVTLKITNPSKLGHDFTSEDLDCQTERFESRESVTVSFKVPPGETDFVCSIHKAVMTGDIIGTK